MAKRTIKPRAKKTPVVSRQTAEYRHPEETPARPDVGTQPQFKKRAAAKTYRYDSSLAPALDWDGQNPAREQGEALIAELEARVRSLRAALAQQVLPPSSPVRNIRARRSSSTEDETRSVPSPLMGEGEGGGEETRRLLNEAEESLRKLKALSKAFLNWAGKAERLSFDVPTLPLFVHERLSTRAILETLKGHKRDKQLDLFDLFSDPQRPIHDQVLRAYEYQDKWVNRMILGDSLVVMNSLLHYEAMGGQVQMIYMDPPYGVKFGSNFQPFVRERDVVHGDDDDMTREPEMVQAYRDTWELGLHSYLTYLRDRLLLSRELLAPSGSIFVQISDENLHHVREVLDEVFGADNFVAVIAFSKTSGLASRYLATQTDFLLWYAKDKTRTKYHQLYLSKSRDSGTAENYSWVELPDGTRRGLTRAERTNPALLPHGARIYKPDNITSQGNPVKEYVYQGKAYRQAWKTTVPEGMDRLARANRLHVAANSLQYVRYLDDFPCVPITQLWDDTATGSFTDQKIYVVQTGTKTVERCVLMTTDPGDIIVDPTCGSGTTAYAAEQWGRRWITIDTSRVPLALARQRLLTATYSWYELNDESSGPAGGFVYRRRQNQKGEEAGGIVPHVMLGTIANNEPAKEEVLVDRPEEAKNVTRVTGPFVVEATIPTVMDVEGTAAGTHPHPSPPPEGEGIAISVGEGDFVERMLEVLRRSPVLRVEGNRTVTLKNVRRPAKTLSLTAEAMVANGQDRPVALVFGPENGAVVERLVYEAAREATAKNYAHLYVIGFAIQPHARQLVESCERAIGIPATYVQATPDLMMGDLLKNMRSSQIFSVCGLPEVTLRKTKAPEHEISKEKKAAAWYEVELLGLDVFDPATMEVHHKRGDDVPAWFLDTNYNGLSFHVCQAFFPRTAAWDNLKRALKGEYEDSVWEHLAKNVSVPFEGGEHGQVAVKVIDDRGNELMVVKGLKEAR
jgi:adenine-specific DNA-methyltransferase